MRPGLIASIFAMSCVVSPAHAEPPAPLGGLVTALSCTMRAYLRCAGNFCYDSKSGETDGTTSVAGASSWAFDFNFKNDTASVGEDYAKNYNKRWPMQALKESPAVVDKPMFVKFDVRTDTQKLFVMIVATPLAEGKGYSFGYGVVSPRPRGREPFAGIDKTINTGKCTPE